MWASLNIPEVAWHSTPIGEWPKGICFVLLEMGTAVAQTRDRNYLQKTLARNHEASWSPQKGLKYMESYLLHDIITDGFDAVAEFLGFKSDLLATVRERIEAGVTGKGPIDHDDALVLRWLAGEWGERLTLLRHHNEPGFNVAYEPVTRLVALVKLALVVRGADEAETMERRPAPLHQPYSEARREENPPQRP